MKPNKTFLILIMLSGLISSVNATSQREIYRLDKAWKFHYGDIQLPNVTSHHGVYSLVKAGNTRSVSGFNYDTSSWQTVDLPHDYVIDGKHDRKESVSHGFLPRPPAWYRRQFKLKPSDREKTVWLYFDGVGGRTTVFVNGQEMVHNNNGYIGFRVNISDVAHYGDKPNSIAVFTDPREPQGWWYEGGGIYRHVWLHKTHKVHVAPFGVYAAPAKKSDTLWQTKIETTIESEQNQDSNILVRSTILDPQGQKAGEVTSKAVSLGRENTTITQNIDINAPKLWDLDTPNLYKVLTEVLINNEVIDHKETTFGYRTIEFDADKGFFLNGRYVKFKGVCMHQDHAGVGVAVPDAIAEFRVARLKEMGSNAYRCSHNPPATEILEACDRLGMLVMNENRFYNSAPEYLDQLREQVLRDRNNPSNIMWSLFNEEPWQGDERGRKMVERMAHLIKKYDTTRPTTGAMNGGYNDQGAMNGVDILGINYNMHAHDRAHKMYSNKHVYGSENVSHFATRGEFITDHKKFTFDNYDRHHANWGSGVRKAWKHVLDRKWNGGMFIWTGFDYRGEPTPKAWPVISSYFGIMDTCGFPKDSFYLCQALWTKKPMAYVFPHWSHDDSMIGKKIKVGVYTNGDEAELFLNGKSLGRHKVPYFDQLYIDVPYQPGKLEVKAYKNGQPHASNFVETTSRAVALGVEAKFGQWQRNSVQSGNRDTLPIAVYAIDKKGRRVPTASHLVTFSVNGGKVLGVGNGNPVSHEADRASKRHLFNGLASAILEVADNTTELVVTVKSPGLKPATLRLPAIKAKNALPQYPSLGNEFVLADWRMAAVTQKPRDPNEKIADNDMNTWERINIGSGPQPHFEEALGYTVYRTSFIMPKDQKSWRLQFSEIVGKAQLYINEEKVASKNRFEAGPLKTTLNYLGGEKITVSLLLEAREKASGLTKTVSIYQLKGKRKTASKPQLLKQDLWLKAEFTNSSDWQTANLSSRKSTRYLAIKVLNSHGNRNFAHAGELRLETKDGVISTKDFKVTYSSSQETRAENGRASNLFDNDLNTFWHSQWKGYEDTPPHIIIVDLGKLYKIKKIAYKSRNGNISGALKEVEFFGKEKPFTFRK